MRIAIGRAWNTSLVTLRAAILVALARHRSSTHENSHWNSLECWPGNSEGASAVSGTSHELATRIAIGKALDTSLVTLRALLHYLGLAIGCQRNSSPIGIAWNRSLVTLKALLHYLGLAIGLHRYSSPMRKLGNID